MTTAVFPATFDPITNGHVDIAERAAAIFERLVLGVYTHPDDDIKGTLFAVEQRVAYVRDAVAHIANAQVRAYPGLTVDFARSERARVIVRGLRVADDFEFERQMAMMNRHLAPDIETLLLISSPEHAFLSASLVRQVGLMGGDVAGLVPGHVASAIAGQAASHAPVDVLRDEA